MIALILFVIFGVAFAYFATQNTTPIDIRLLGANYSGIPTYMAILASLTLGLIIGSLLYMVKAISTMFSLKGRDKGLKEAQKENVELTKRIHILELENTRLKTRLGEENVDDDSL